MSEKKLAMKVSVVTIVINALLSAFKLFAGIVGNSAAMISDAVHSASDVLSTFVVMAGVAVANKESDSTHRYGHEKMESIAGMLLAVLLFVTGAGIGVEGMKKIFAGGTIRIPSMLAMVAAVISIVVKEWMYWYTRRAAKKINSGALMADAWHHRSDALSSVGSFVGIFGARLGYPVLDSVASLVICVFIIKAAYDIFMDAVDKLVDKSCDDETVQQMNGLIEQQQGVMAVDEIRTRLFGNRIYVDVEISADGSQSLYEAHEIAQRVHDALEANFTSVKHCMVHVNPYGQRH